jgi:hypothetical protein
MPSQREWVNYGLLAAGAYLVYRELRARGVLGATENDPGYRDYIPALPASVTAVPTKIVQYTIKPFKAAAEMLARPFLRLPTPAQPGLEEKRRRLSAQRGRAAEEAKTRSTWRYMPQEPPLPEPKPKPKPKIWSTPPSIYAKKGGSQEGKFANLGITISRLSQNIKPGGFVDPLEKLKLYDKQHGESVRRTAKAEDDLWRTMQLAKAGDRAAIKALPEKQLILQAYARQNEELSEDIILESKKQYARFLEKPERFTIPYVTSGEWRDISDLMPAIRVTSAQRIAERSRSPKATGIKMRMRMLEDVMRNAELISREPVKFAGTRRL